MPTTSMTEKSTYRDRIFDPYTSIMIFVASLIALFPIFILLAYILEGEFAKMATTYVVITSLVTITGSYLFSKTIGYNNFLEKYHEIVPTGTNFTDYFSDRKQDYIYFKELYREFMMFFDELDDSTRDIDSDQWEKLVEALNAYKNTVLNTNTGEEITRVCNLLIPFESAEFRGIEISEIKQLSKEFYALYVKFSKEIKKYEGLLIKLQKFEIEIPH